MKITCTSIIYFLKHSKYRISSYSFRGNYSSFFFEYGNPKVTYINVPKLFKGGNYEKIRYVESKLFFYPIQKTTTAL